MSDTRELPVLHCARCGQDHERMAFKRFTRPIEDADGTIWAWWSLCPVTGEPVLMRDEDTIAVVGPVAATIADSELKQDENDIHMIARYVVTRPGDPQPGKRRKAEEPR